MSTLFSDNFNRADNATVDATNWEENLAADWEIFSNKLRNGAAQSSPSACLTTAAAHAATADVKVTVTQANGGSLADGGPVARWASTAHGGSSLGYAADVYTAKCEIYRHDTSGSGTLLRTAAVTQVANGVIRLEVSGTGATVTLKVFYNGVQQGADVSDGSASRITAANRTGVYSWSNSTSTGQGDYDDFLVEDFASGSIVFRSALSRPFPFKPGSPRYQ